MAIKNKSSPWSTPTARIKPTDLNDTSNYLERTAILTVENAVRTLQSNDVYNNGPNIVVDDMTDSTGTNNTVNTGSSTSDYDALNLYYTLSFTDEASGDTTHNPNSFTNPSNAFDGDDSTYSEISVLEDDATGSLGKTFSPKTIKNVKIKAEMLGDNPLSTIRLESYNGSTWSTEEILVNESGSIQSFEGSLYLNKSVQGLRVYMNKTYDGGGYTQRIRLYTLEYSTTFDSSSTVIADTNTTTLDGNELGFAISVPDSDFPTGTSITATISDGTNSLTATAIDTVSKGVIIGNPGTLSSGTLKCTFTLSTTDSSVIPTLPSYGIGVLR